MHEHLLEVPDFWITNLDYVKAQAETVNKAEVRVLTQSAGGRPVYCFSYGEKQEMKAAANYNSACGAHDLSCYKPVKGKKPVVLLLGAIHGAEVEGTAAIMNLISLMEKGVDLAGKPNDALMRAVQGVRLVLVPVCNPDGRARLPFESVLGMTMAEGRYWFQGAWPDGSLVGCPDCKLLHPMKGCGFLGTYYNDDGINLMHDNFFHPWAKETQALLDLADEEKSDICILLHGGSQCYNEFTRCNYASLESQLAVHDLSVRCDASARKEGLQFQICPIPVMQCSGVPPMFNLTSAMHHVCGTVSCTFESNQNVTGEPGVHLDHEQVLRSHMILFEETCLMAKERVGDRSAWSTL